MKRLTALILCILLALAIPLGAAAAEEEDDYSENSSYNGYSARGYDGYRTWLSQLKEQHPEILDEIMKDDPPLWQEYGFSSLDEMLEAYGISEEEYYNNYVLYYRAYSYYLDYLIETDRESMGAPATGLAVMINGEYINFPDAQPEYNNGQTMVPIRAIMEYLKGSIEYSESENSITIDINDRKINFNVGENSMQVESEGETNTVELESNTYIKDGSVYVPVRAISEAAGYDVLWDEDYETAVIMDKNAIIESVNSDFSIINKVLSVEELDSEKTYKNSIDAAATITKFSTLDGNSTFNVSGSLTIVKNGHAQQISAALNMKELIQFILLQEDDMDEETINEIESLSNIKMDVIANLDEGITYIKCPAMADILGIENTNAWIKYEGNPEDVLGYTTGSNIVDMSAEYGGSVGSYIYQSYAYYNADYPVHAYSDIMSEKETLADVFGDSKFRRSDNTYTLSMDRDDYENLAYGQLPKDEYGYDFKQFELTVDITEDSNGEFSKLTGDFKMRTNDRYGDNDTQLTGSFAATETSETINVEVHVENMMKIEYTVKEKLSETTETLLTEPPAGSEIVDYNDIEQNY